MSDAGRPDVLARMRDLDRRKLAVGKKAQDAKVRHQREMWRASKKRSRAKAAKAMTVRTQQSQSDPALTSREKDKLFNQLFGDPEPAKVNPIRNELDKLSRDRKAPASARVTALRTIAEMDGHLGRLQRQGADTSGEPLGALTRAQLEEELARLRAIVAERDA